jgi:hypothetical protein
LEDFFYPNFDHEERGNRFDRNSIIDITEMHGVTSADNILAALCSKVLPSRREMMTLHFRPTKRATHFLLLVRHMLTSGGTSFKLALQVFMFLLGSWLLIYLLCDPRKF